MKRPFPSLWLKSVKLTGSNLVALVLSYQKGAAESKIAGTWTSKQAAKEGGLLLRGC